MKVGAAHVIIDLKDDFFPNVESVLKHDDVYVRVLIIETFARYAILEADMPSMFPPDIAYCKELLKSIAGVDEANSWIVVNHSFSSPHTWSMDANVQRDTFRPKALDGNIEFINAAKKINQAYRDAYEAAIREAASEMQEAVVGFAAGQCGINVNRNVETADGWWEGVNYEGYTDRHLGVVRFNDMEGNLLAVLYNYSCQVGVVAGVFKDLNGRITSADLVGYASAYVERTFPGATAIFMCGATGDQAPLFRCNYFDIDKDGHYYPVSLDYTCVDGILTSMGTALGSSVVQTVGKVTEYSSPENISVRETSYICGTQKREADMHKMKPTRHFEYIPDGERNLKAYAMIIGDIAMVGLLPELDGITVAEIREGSPFAKTIVSCFVNGNAKSMPQAKSYDQFHRTAMNSPFARGSAEKTRDVAIDLLKSFI